MRHFLTKFEYSLEKKNSNQEHCKLLVDSEETDNATKVFKKQEFQAIEITKTWDLSWRMKKKWKPCMKIILKKPSIETFSQNQKRVNVSIMTNQMIVTETHPYCLNLKNLVTVQSLIIHPNPLLIQDHMNNYY